MAYYGWMQEGPAPSNSGLFAACNSKIKMGPSNGVKGLPGLEMTEQTVTDTTRCCLQYCLKPVEICRQKCPRGSDCEGICETQEDLCTETCRLSSDEWSNEFNPYFACAHKHGCLTTGEDKNACLAQHYKAIMDCCVSDKCRPSRNVDCKDLCKMSYEIARDADLEFEIDPEVALRKLFIRTLRRDEDIEQFEISGRTKRTHPYSRI